MVNVRKYRFACFALAIIVISLACGPGSTSDAGKPTVEINSPVNGSSVYLGVELYIVSTSHAQSGISKVELGINGQQLIADAPLGNPETHVANMSWVPLVEGAAVISVIAYDAQGNASDPALITVQVIPAEGEPPEESPPMADTSIPPTDTVILPTDYPTNTPYPTYTPYPTFTPTPSPTSQFLLATQVFFSPGIFSFLPAVERVDNSISINGGNSGSVSVDCPGDSIVVSGGFVTNSDVMVYEQRISGNGWKAYGKNNGGAVKKLYVYAVCLSNTTGSVTTHASDANASGGGIGNPKANCPSGSIITGGGWKVPSDPDVVVYVSAKNGNGWEIFAHNKTGSNKSIRVYAVCMSDTSGVIGYKSMTSSLSANNTGYSIATCTDSLNIGGGFRTSSSVSIYNTSPRPGYEDQWIVYGRNHSGSSQFLQADTLCLTFP
ncbi:MAG: hypothetical protein PVF83_14515 [Anaerolineales bacterium]|jgi:hypothetical protein